MQRLAGATQGNRQAYRPNFDVRDDTLYKVPKWEELTEPLSHAGHAFLAARGISREVIKANDVRTAFKNFTSGGKWHKVECLAFPYKREGDVVAVKYRSLEGVSTPQLPQHSRHMRVGMCKPQAAL